MLKIEDHCCGCAAPGYPCEGDACPRRHVKVYYCDKCGAELDEVYEVDGEDLCEDCLKKMFLKEVD
jgi:DNA-directed RNA polymerase subunit RPC12/RpoP